MALPLNLPSVRSLMLEFAGRTGLSSAATPPRRYLWTDAFAVCNFLSLYEASQDTAWLGLATGLVDQVHHTLGRHRSDDDRVGWISGLEEDAGRRHPTAGGLRIGKRLPERSPGRRVDEVEEWDRDGQYFHYLTKWMQALARMAVVTGDPIYLRLAIELAKTAHAAFTYPAPGDGALRMYWKMSIDLSHPQVPSMGQHDPLDALVSYSLLELCRLRYFDSVGLPDLRAEIDAAAGMCARRAWVTDDPLGIGGMLVDAYRIGQLEAHGVTVSAVTLNRLLTDARIGLLRFARAGSLDAPAEHRLAFRELGLSIGLRALEALRREAIDGAIAADEDASTELDRLIGVVALAGQIEAFWQQPRHQASASWREHLDINSVMLATSLLPRQFLIVDDAGAAA